MYTAIQAVHVSALGIAEKPKQQQLLMVLWLFSGS